MQRIENESSLTRRRRQALLTVAFALTLLLSDCCSHTAALTLPLSHCRSHTAALTLPLSLFQFITTSTAITATTIAERTKQNIVGRRSLQNNKTQERQQQQQQQQKETLN